MPDGTTAVSNHGCDLVTDLARTTRAQRRRKIVTLKIQQSDFTDWNDIGQKIFELLQNCFFAPAQRQYETDYVYKDGIMLIPRLKPNGTLKEWFQRATAAKLSPEPFQQEKRVLRLHSEASDKPDSLYFIDDPTLDKPIDPLEIEIQAEAYGVNFERPISSDHLKVSRSTLGECAGVVSAVGSHFKDQYKPGDRVCGWGQIAYASRTRVKGHNVQLLPSSMPYKIGASIPVAFITAYYALVSLANMSEGETVLIHAAAVDTGQAALQIAQKIGAVVFTTVRTDSERTLLLDTFKLRRECVLSIEAATFRREIKRLTQGLGVDIIVDSLEGENLEANWACIARFGKFIRFGGHQGDSGNFVRTKDSETNTAQFSADVAALSEHRPQMIGDIMKQVLKMFKDGELQPIYPLTSMGLAEIGKAFKIVQSRQRVGKLVIEPSSDSLVLCAPSPVPPVRFSQAGTYVIAGDFGALGLDVCRFMATRGAKHVALVSWGLTAFEQQRHLGEALRHLGISLHVVSPESSDRFLEEALISSPLRKCPPIKGVVQADMVPQVRGKLASA
jgi:NADPH:quinone reductase-like Zn-dependent oxidoreductase